MRDIIDIRAKLQKIQDREKELLNNYNMGDEEWIEFAAQIDTLKWVLEEESNMGETHG